MKVNKILLTTAVIASLGTTAFAADTTVGTGNGIAYGTATEAIGVKSIAIGNTVKASDDNSIAIGYDASAKGINAIAIGSSQITNSSENPDTKTLVDGENSLAIGQAAQVTSNDSIAIGKDSKVYDSSNISTVVGYGAKSSAYMGSAFGANAHAGGSSSFAMGSFSEALGDSSVAIGQQAKAEKTDSYALGSGAEATNYYSSALGSNSHATGNGATAIGTASNANGDNSVAIGSYAVTKGENNVTLGSQSVDDNIVATSHIFVNGHDYKFAGDDPYGTVSVGGVVDYDFVKDADGNPVLNEDGTGYLMVKKHLTRTITNVAAGRIDETSTDAINGSQLNAVINSLNFTTVVDGDNTTVTESTNINGGKEFKVDVNKNLTNMNSAVFKDNSTNQSDFKHLAEVPTMYHLDKRGETKIDGSVIELHNTAVNGEPEQLTAIDGKHISFNRSGDYKTSVDIDGIYTIHHDQGMNAYAGGIEVWGHENGDDNTDIREMSFTVSKVDVGGQQIHRVTAVTEDTDAVNVSQLKEVKQLTVDNKKAIENHEVRIGDLENKITDVGQNAVNQANHYTDLQVAKVGANAAALAALHPLDYNPDHKTDIMAGVGHYKGKTAVALGVAHRPNENTMVTFGTTINGKDTMVNAGVSYKVGAKGSTYKSPLKMAKEIDDLKAIVDKLLKDNQELHKALENK